MDKKQLIGLRIKTMRQSRKMTQADLARAINQSQSSITMYENVADESLILKHWKLWPMCLMFHCLLLLVMKMVMKWIRISGLYPA